MTQRATPTTASRGIMVRTLLVGAALGYLGVMLAVPLSMIFAKAFEKGLAAYAAAVTRPETVSAIALTLVTVAIVVPLNVVFGIAAAWSIGKFQFRGKSFLTTLIELPLGVSPVVSGLAFVLLFGAQGWFGPWLAAHGLNIVFARPAIVLATLFVTAPLVARELIPLVQTQGNEPELAAVTLGARGWQTFRLVSLPSLKWGLLYGTALCSARAMGEFGAVSVVSGHIRGRTITMPLQVEILYNEYDSVGAFAIASLLTLIAVATLLAKAVLERRERQRATPAAERSMEKAA